jgi:hypothetical protein
MKWLRNQVLPLCMLALFSSPSASGQSFDGGQDLILVDVPETVAVPIDVLVDDPGDGYVPNDDGKDIVKVNGYVDVGFAKASGNGSSFLASDTRVPLDYVNDAFAPMVNSRGEVASIDTQGRLTNGFLPRSVGINSNASFLLNTASFDVKFQPKSWPLLVFARAQLMPRLGGAGDATRVELQQAFGRYSPFASQELALFLGRFDSVFGIEYLENEANLRVGITPSLISRYTTGHGLGAKAFYRIQIPSLWSALSVNVAATNNGTRIEALVPVDASLTGGLSGSGRLGFEVNHPLVQLKLGVSGLYGVRNDQLSFEALQRAVGADLRLSVVGISLSAEGLLLLDDYASAAGKITAIGPAKIPSGFSVAGAWIRLAYTIAYKNDVLSGLTFYGRYEQRRGTFTNAPKPQPFESSGTTIVTSRITAGLKLDLWDILNLKAEYLRNDELSGAAVVDNDVFTTSIVFTW